MRRVASGWRAPRRALPRRQAPHARPANTAANPRMFVIIMGCGRVGARLALMLTHAGHEVSIMDVTSSAFSRLGPDFRGITILGDGTDQEVLKRAGLDRADAFVAATQGDNRNIMASQIAKHAFRLKHVVTRIYAQLRTVTSATP